MKRISILLLQVFLLSGCALLLPPKDEITIYTSDDFDDKAISYAIIPDNSEVIKRYPVAYGAFRDAFAKAITSRSASGDTQLTIKVDIKPIHSHTSSHTYKSPIRGVTSMTDRTRTTYDSNTGKMIKTHESIPVYGITGYEEKTHYHTTYYGEVIFSACGKGKEGSNKRFWYKSFELKSDWKINQKTLTCLAKFVSPFMIAKSPEFLELKAYRWQITKDCK